jgi:hypothetical protein
MPARLEGAVLACALALVWGPAPAAAPEGADRLCPQSAPTPAPVPKPVAGCSPALCTAVGHEQACNCQRGERWFAQRRRAGQLVQQWATEVSLLMGAEALQVTQADVDGDGQPEWLLSQFLSQSNGLGVSTHRLCVLWTRGAKRAPLCREVSEWQQLTVLVQEPGRNGCSLLDGGWHSGLHAGDKSRGPGTYAVGRLLRLQGTHWRAAADRPAVSRRLLDGFMNERETLQQSNAQRLWYQHPDARAGTPAARQTR